MIAQFSRVLTLILSITCCFGQHAPPESASIFHSGTTLVLTTFNVVRGRYFAPDVKADEIVLLEDGKPRDFTIFEDPGTARRPPVELILLFDTTTLPPPESKITVLYTYWDRKATYSFTNHWSDKDSLAVLEKGGAEVRVSVYRYDQQQLQRLCRPTSDPQTLTRAIQRLPEAIPASEAIPLKLPRGGMALPRPNPKRLFWPLSWTQEAVIETLKDSNQAPNNAVRALVVFSETVGPTTTTEHDVAEQANALGIPVYPVVLDFDEYMRHPFVTGIVRGGGIPAGSVPMARPESAPAYDPAATSGLAANPTRTVGNMSAGPLTRFGSLGELTGVESLYPSRLDAAVVNDILSVIRDKCLSQYVVGFSPPSSGRQRKHTLEIKLRLQSSDKLRGGKRTAVY